MVCWHGSWKNAQCPSLGTAPVMGQVWRCRGACAALGPATAQQVPLLSPQQCTGICTSSCSSCRWKPAAPILGLSITVVPWAFLSQFTSLVLLVMSPLCQGSKVLCACPLGFSCQPQHRALLEFHEQSTVYPCFRMCSALTCRTPTHSNWKSWEGSTWIFKTLHLCFSLISRQALPATHRDFYLWSPSGNFTLHMTSVLSQLSQCKMKPVCVKEPLHRPHTLGGDR